MNTTRRTLLARVRDRGDEDAWESFYELYAPLLYQYARRLGLSATDAEEVRDQCLEVVSRRMPEFEYDRKKGCFKGWLHRIVSGRVIDLRRARQHEDPDSHDLHTIPDPEPSPDDEWERRWRHRHLFYCLERLKERVPATSYEVFRRLLLDGATVPEVCADLGLNPNQVYKAKSQMLRRVRASMRELGVKE